MSRFSSVGKGGVNQKADVIRIQLALNVVRQPGKLSPIAVDGVVGPQTIGAITDFQKRYTNVADGRIDPHGPTLRALEDIVGPAVEPAVRAGILRTLESLAYVLRTRRLRLPPDIQSSLDEIASATQGLKGGPTLLGTQFAVYYPQWQRSGVQLVVAAAAAPAAAAAAAEAAALALLAMIAILIIIQNAPAMGRAIEDLMRKIQVLMARLLDTVKDAIDGIEDLVKRNSKAGMQCSALLILFRTLSKQLIDLLTAPRPTDELGRRRLQKQLQELFEKWQKAMQDLLNCLIAHGAT